MIEKVVKFDRPEWWLFIMAFRYAIARRSTISDLHNVLLDNIEVINERHREEYLNQMIQQSAQQICLDCMHKDLDAIQCRGDVADKLAFMNACVDVLNKQKLRLHNYSAENRDRALEYWRVYYGC